MSSEFWNAEGTKIAGDVNSVGLRSSRFANLCTPGDAKSCNYYQKGNSVIVETIAQYLERMITGSRSLGQQITVILPIEGYELLSEYDMSEWEDASTNFDPHYYTFNGGLADENFVEIVTHPPVTIAEESKDLAIIGDDQKLRINKQGIANVVTETVGPTINNIVNETLPTVIKTTLGNNHESYLIENTENEAETVESSWTVIPYNEQVGEFKAVVMVRDKSLNEIKTLMTILSFDYADAVKVVNENAMLIDGSITLTCGVDDGTNKLFATITGMTTNAKRIHLCFERCVLSVRFRDIDIDSDINLILETTAYLQAYLNLQATANMALNFEFGLSGYSNLQAELPMVLDSSAILTAYGRIQANMNMELDGQALLTAYKKLIADGIPMTLNAQAILKAYASLSAVNIPMSLVMQAQLAQNYLNLHASVPIQYLMIANLTQAQVANPLLSGLVAWYKMKQDDSSDLIATIGSNGSGTNIVKSSDSPTNGLGSYYFNGSNAFGVIDWPAIRYPFTISIWIKTTPGFNNMIFGDLNSNLTNLCPGFLFYPVSSNTFYNFAVWYNNHTGAAMSSVFSGFTSSWMRVALVCTGFSGGTLGLKIYKNGVLVTSSSPNFSGNALPFKSQLGLAIMKQSSGSVDYRGNYYGANLCIWNKALSAAELVLDYNNGSAWYQ